MDLIKIELMKTDHGYVDCVSSKDLYLFLGLAKSQFSRWALLNIVNNKFAVEFEDYLGFDIMANGNSTRDYAVSIPFAKKLSMLTRTGKGEQIREYFLKCEKVVIEQEQFQVPESFADALELAAYQAREIEQLEAQKLLDTPKVEFAEIIQSSEDTLGLSEFAKVIGQGPNKFRELLRNNKVLMEEPRKNQPYQKYIDQGYFKTTETLIEAIDKLHIMALITVKGQEWIVKKLRDWL